MSARNGIEIVRLTHIPAEPRAGQSFVLIVELDREVDPSGQNETVSIEKQRLVADIGGFPVTRPTGPDYFLAGFEPRPVSVAPGTRFGVSQPIIIRKDASAQDGEAPVHFPENLLFAAFIGSLEASFCSDLVRVQAPEEVRRLLAATALAAGDLMLGQKVPNRAERDVVGASTTKIVRGTQAFAALVENTNPDIVFKDEEGTGADRMMTPKLKSKIDTLATLVKNEWPGVKLRITEAWDENNEHGPHSVHYEARGADLTTSDRDGAKLGRLGRLAVDAGFEWVFFENSAHVHASVSR